MPTLAQVVVASVILVPIAACAAEIIQITPGRWQVTWQATTVIIDGKEQPVTPPPGEGTVVTFQCVSAKEGRDPALLFKDSGPGETCGLNRGTVAEGRIALTGECREAIGGPGKMALNGTYDSRTFHAAMRLNLNTESGPTVVNSTIDGKFVGRCRGDEEK